MSDRLIVERRVNASPEVVYRYLTGSEEWARWQGTQARIDPVPGGIFRMAMNDGRTARGEFVRLDPGRRVVFTWGWVDHPGLPPGSTTVEIELIPDGTGTIVRLTHSGLPADERDLHQAGWNHYLPRLARVATGGDPGPDPGPGGGNVMQ